MRGISVANKAAEGLWGLSRLRSLSWWLAGIASGAMLMALQANAQTVAPGGVSATGVGSSFESQYWASVDGASDPALYEAYLAKYPNGTFADLARIKMMKLRSNAAPPPPAPPRATEPAPPPGTPDDDAQGAPENPSSGMVPPADTPSLQTPGKMPTGMIPVRSDQAVRSDPDQGVPMPGFPAPRPKPNTGAEAPYVTKVVPADGDAGDSKLNDLLDAINPAAHAKSNQAPVPPAASPPPSAQMSDRTPGPVASNQAPMSNGYGQVQTTPPASPGISYGPPAKDQGYQHPIAVGALPPDFALPPRPILIAVPPVNFPESFCSAEARNAFHNNVYRPAVEAATRNNDLTGVYLRELQSIYDRYNLSGTAEPQNAIAVESRAYKQISDQAFFTQSALVSAFKSLMAVPIIPCEPQR